MSFYIVPALLPIFTALLLMTAFRWSPGKVMPLALVMTLGFAGFLWRVPAADLAVYSLAGCAKALDIVLIVFAAVLLLNVMKASGKMELIDQALSQVSADRRIQVLIIGWMSSGFMEGASGFGAAPALAAPLLYAMGFPPLIAVVVSLICNTLPVPFGAAGIPVITSSAVLSERLAADGVDQGLFLTELMDKITSISGWSGFLIPLAAVAAMLLLSGDKKIFRHLFQIAPLAVFAGLAFILPWKLCSRVLGPELPSMAGGAIGMVLLLAAVHFKFLVPRQVWDFPGAENRRTVMQKVPFRELAGAFMPYLVLALALLITRMPQLPVGSWLKIPVLTVGSGSSAWRWAYLNNPGVFPLFPAALFFAWFWHLDRHKCKSEVWIKTCRQTALPVLAIISSAAAVQVMVMSGNNHSCLPGMLTLAAQGFSSVLGSAYLWGAPFLGVLGSSFSGSCTVSNLLFSTMQYDTAQLLGLSPGTAVALQNIGGGLGSMIRIGGVIAACATVNLSRQEGKIILLNLVWVVLFGLLAGLAAQFAG